MAITTDILSERLVSIRKASGLTMAQVANACNVSSGSVSNYEGGREPTLTFMKDFCVFFGLSLDNFLDEDFDINTYVSQIITIVRERGGFEGYQPLNSSKTVIAKNNIISGSRTKEVSQVQGANHVSLNELDMLRKENEFLKQQLKFTQELLEKAMSK